MRRGVSQALRETPAEGTYPKGHKALHCTLLPKSEAMWKRLQITALQGMHQWEAELAASQSLEDYEEDRRRKEQVQAEAEAKRYRRQPEEDEGEQGGEDDDMSPKLPELRLNRLRFVRSMQYFEKLRNPQEAKAINRLFSSFDVTISDSIDLVELCLYCRDMAILRPMKPNANMAHFGRR